MPQQPPTGTIDVARFRRSHWSADANTVHDQEDAMGFVRRRARRRTALVVGGAAYAAGRHGARQQDQDYGGGGSDQPSGEPAPAAPAPATPSGAIDYDELKQLGELHSNGTLTDEEFAAAKAKILGT